MVLTMEEYNYYNVTRESPNHVITKRKGEKGVDTKKRRFILSVPSDIEADIADMKQTLFQDMSYSEMYRVLIRTGLDALKKEEKRRKGNEK